MAIFRSQLSTSSDAYTQNRSGMLALIDKTRQLEQRAVDASAKAKPRFDKRGQILPRERIARLLDPGAPFLEIGNMTGYLMDTPDPEESLPGASHIAGIGFVSGVRAMIVASDSGINAGAFVAIGGAKMRRCQDIALENKLPFIHLVESAGANLLEYEVEMFIDGGGIFRRLAQLSAAGCPVITILHGSSTAGGAYMPGLSDVVIGVRGRGQAFLAGPPLVKAATGEIANSADLGGAEMHASISGTVEHLAENDTDAIRLAREVVSRLNWQSQLAAKPYTPSFKEPRYSPDELAGLVPLDYRQPYDVKEVIARLVDDSDLLEFKSRYGSATVCVQANIHGHAVGMIGNNGPINPDGATKAAHFIQHCTQTNTPLVYLQNTTGYMVGTAYEQGASFGAGNYGMCGRAYDPTFLFTWPNAVSGVMGGEQAAGTMRMVIEASAKRRGQEVDSAEMDAKEQEIIELFDRQSSALYTSGRGLDDGIIDPRDSRKMLAFVLATTDEAQRRKINPTSFGVARM